MWTELRRRLQAPRDASALAAFRIALGLLVAISALRFLAYGWVDDLFVRPRVHLTYWDFGWVRPLPGAGMHALFAALVALGLMVAAGLCYRPAIALLFLAFTYVQLVDAANYLNHYYLVSLLAGLCCFIPLHRTLSLDARLRPRLRAAALPAWCTYLLRFQVAVVYLGAALAKLTGDWLLHAQPLNIWLSARTSVPVLGPLLDSRPAAFVASWFGFLFDGTIIFFLAARRTRAAAYALVVIFHAATSVLFPIGMFPAIMVTAALVFFDPGWPRRLALRLRWRLPAPAAAAPPAPAAPPPPAVGLVPAALFLLVQVALPLRSHLYGGNVLWHEQGFRFSWRVMAREKNGSVDFLVRDPRSGREWFVPPRRYLTRIQEREMTVQPDLILQLARRIAADFRRAGHGDVEVRADAWVSLNGRPAERLVDASVDLAREVDGLNPKPWILPAPTTPPAHLSPLVWRSR